MRMSEAGLEMLKEFEGCILHVYKDVAGYKTIGVGHLLTKEELNRGTVSIGGVPVDLAKPITMQQALQLLAQDVVPAEKAVERYIQVELSQNQFDALVSFTFNCGVGALQQSSLRTELNKGNYEVVPAKLSLWNKAGGKVCDTLVRRRCDEGKLFTAVA